MASDVDNTAEQKVVVAETPYGKDISIAKCASGRMFEIIISDGGVKPLPLQGKFTDYRTAAEAIEHYEKSRPVRPEKPKRETLTLKQKQE